MHGPARLTQTSDARRPPGGRAKRIGCPYSFREVSVIIESHQAIYSLYTYVCMCVRIRMCLSVCVGGCGCVCKKKKDRKEGKTESE